jgi:hypothetical protein
MKIKRKIVLVAAALAALVVFGAGRQLFHGPDS